MVGCFLREEGKGFGGILTTSNSLFLIPQIGERVEHRYTWPNEYQIYPHHINKITNYEKVNYSPSP